MDDICVVHIGWIKGGTAIQSPFASPMGCRGLFCCFKWIQPLPGGLLQREKLYLLMFSRNLFVLDFVRRFFVSCAQIFEAYVDKIRAQLAENRPQRQVQERLREDIL